MEQITSQNANTNIGMGATKKSNDMKYGMITCAVLATAGIGFGVYGMTRQPETRPTQNAAINAEIESELAELKSKYSVLQNYVKNLESSGTEVPEEAKSAAIATTMTKVASLDVSKSLNWGDDSKNNLVISQAGHQNSVGWMALNQDRKSVASAGFSESLLRSYGLNAEDFRSKTFTFTSTGGTIYDFYVGGYGQAAGGENLYLIMDDGSLEYVPLQYALKHNDYSAKKVSGVTGIERLAMVQIHHKQGGGWVSTLAIKADGSWYDLSQAVDQSYYAQ